MPRYFVSLRSPVEPGALFQPTWYANEAIDAPDAATARDMARIDHERLRLTPTGDPAIDEMQKRQPPASALEAYARISKARR